MLPKEQATRELLHCLQPMQPPKHAPPANPPIDWDELLNSSPYEVSEEMSEPPAARSSVPAASKDAFGATEVIPLAAQDRADGAARDLDEAPPEEEGNLDWVGDKPSALSSVDSRQVRRLLHEAKMKDLQADTFRWAQRQQSGRLRRSASARI
jgi:hypothetical protein